MNGGQEGGTFATGGGTSLCEAAISHFSLVSFFRGTPPRRSIEKRFGLSTDERKLGQPNTRDLLCICNRTTGIGQTFSSL